MIACAYPQGADGLAGEASTGLGPTLAYQSHSLTHDGDPDRGRQLFHKSQQLNCHVCHRVGEQGGEVGPDLTAIGGKFDRPLLIESLLEPSRQIVEGYRTSSIITDEGRVLTGIIKDQSDTRIQLADASGNRHLLDRATIEEIVASPQSLMPSNLAELMTVDEFTDLIAYLETLRPGGKRSPGADIAGAVKLPPGFRIRTVATGLTGSTAMEVGSDGRVFLCEQSGVLRVVQNDQLLPTPVLAVSVDSLWERGLIGVTLDPMFPAEPYIYVCYVAKEPYPHHRISRFRAQDNQVLVDSEQLLLEGDDQNTLGGTVPAGHQGGGVHFGPDGMLYIGIGEQTAELPSQNLDTFQGKILRIARDGTIPADNPFIHQTQGKYQAIWCLGLRNPFTFAFDPRSQDLLVNDVGGAFEEINRIERGKNYGWPVADHGPTTDRCFTGPIHFYPQASIAGGDFSRYVGEWPEACHNRYFFGDFVLGCIKYLDPKQPQQATTFIEGLTRPVDLRFAPGGSLYVYLRNAWVRDGNFQPHTGSLVKIWYESGH